MRNRRLHDSLRAFALDAARALSADIEAGAEVAFELDERSTGRSVLYRYRPLIATFVSERWQQLRTLESFAPAAEELGTGSAAYLRVQGLAADPDAEPALLAMLERLWEDATSFAFPEDRFERVYEEVERALYEGVLQSAIAAPLPGLVMERDRIDLGDGLALVRGDLSGAPPEAVWPAGSSEIERGRVQPYVVAVIETELPADAQLPVPEARWRLRRLVTALRLWRAGAVSLPETGWARADEGPWRQVQLQSAPPARGGAWALGAEEEESFKQFAALVADWDPAGPLAWALARFDMGCERGSDAEALSDYLLALRGLLDAVDEAGQPTLARRLAALCAEEANRQHLMSRVDAALQLELALISGVPIDAWVAPAGIRSGRDLVGEVEEHLRALLRDVVCGYLKPELAATADEILYRGHPVEIEVRDTRGDVAHAFREDADAGLHKGVRVPVMTVSGEPYAVDPETGSIRPIERIAPPDADPIERIASAGADPIGAIASADADPIEPIAPPAGAAAAERSTPHPLDPPTTFDPPAPPAFDSPTGIRMPGEGPRNLPEEPHHERHAAREFALMPPEAEPRVTRLVDVINEDGRAAAQPAPVHEQPALVVDDFAWDLDEPEDYSAPV